MGICITVENVDEKIELIKRKNIIYKRIDDLGVYKANLVRFKLNQIKYIEECDNAGEGTAFMRSWAEKRIEFLDEEMNNTDMEARALFDNVSDIEARLIEIMEMSGSKEI